MTTEKKGCLAFAVCGSFCTLEDALGAAQALTAQGWTLLPVMSFAAQQDTRFGTGESWRQRLQAVAGQPVLDVFVQVSEVPLLTVNGRQFLTALLEVCGGDNIFAGLVPLVPQARRHRQPPRPPRAAPRIATQAGTEHRPTTRHRPAPADAPVKHRGPQMAPSSQNKKRCWRPSRKRSQLLFL